MPSAQITQKLDFDDMYMQLAVSMAARSHCVRKHVGAVIAKDNRIISTGYNGPPPHTKNCDKDFPATGCQFPKGCKKEHANSCYLAIHAEQNAILYAVEHHAKLQGATLYVTLSPCISCARLIQQIGFAKVIYLTSYATYKGIGIDEGIEFLKEFGNVETEKYPHENRPPLLNMDNPLL